MLTRTDETKELGRSSPLAPGASSLEKGRKRKEEVGTTFIVAARRVGVCKLTVTLSRQSYFQCLRFPTQRSSPRFEPTFVICNHGNSFTPNLDLSLKFTLTANAKVLEVQWKSNDLIVLKC